MTTEMMQEFIKAYSPSNLRYVTALRGYIPSQQIADYNYCMLNCGAGELLIALAASNPDGQFFGFDGNADAIAKAEQTALMNGVSNVSFAQADTYALAGAINSGDIKPPVFDFVVANLCSHTLDTEEVATTVTLANKMLIAGGVCYVAYPTTTKGDVAGLDQYVGSYKPGICSTDEAHGAGKQVGLEFLGSAKIRNNFMEFSAPTSAHEILMREQGKPVYESLKDIASGTKVRHDVWIKPGLEFSAHPVPRFNDFLFTLTVPKSYVDPNFTYFDKKLPLSSGVFTRLISLLSGMPYSIGDLLTHPEMDGINAEDMLNGVMILTAIGYVEVTRSSYEFTNVGNFNQPMLNTLFNQRLRKTAITAEPQLLAAPTLGRPVMGSPIMLMTLIALDKGGMSEAEMVLAEMLNQAEPAVKNILATNLDTQEARLNAAYKLLEQSVNEWLMFSYIQGILKPTP